MKINVHEIEADAKELAYEEPTDALNPLLDRGAVRDFEFVAPVDVRVTYYRAGQELFFSGSLRGPVVGHCARCLDDFVLDMNRSFNFVLVPYSEEGEQTGLNEDDLELSVYRGDEVDLSGLLREQILLALPTRPLCAEDCQGLCPQCGANRNKGTCRCPAPEGDPRLAVLRGLKVGH